MTFSPSPDGMAESAIAISVVGFSIMTILLLLLVLRRYWIEQRQNERRDSLRMITAQLMVWLSGDDVGAKLADAPRQDKLDALVHLYQLVRGSDRQKLGQFAIDNRLLQPIIARARRGSVNSRIDAVRILEWVGQDESIKALKQVLLRDANPRIRLEAAAALAQLDALPYPKILVTALDLETTKPTRLHRALFRAAAPKYGPELVAMLRRKIPDELRAALVDALGWTGDYSSLEHLAAASHHANPLVRRAALRAASQVNHPAAAPWIFALLDDQDETVRELAAQTCAHLGLRKAMPKLREMERDASPWVRLRVEQALGAMAEPA
ncbi:HEAT repeat domain-containing protein [Parasphingopyxis marina]|uniref:HEAT repeat domain-containing protein n=1 Tax=Parasphingopyxis marina TaxID=2761622 RepID=A0A842HYX4_9SPHN|nr:HEAT repeat domain-containing protein [Parasphingopyxis marina]MBC2778132.1 HEAT repeat domain-containing protein [Parasphingopyxis marina]